MRSLFLFQARLADSGANLRAFWGTSLECMGFRWILKRSQGVVGRFKAKRLAPDVSGVPRPEKMPCQMESIAFVGESTMRFQEEAPRSF